VNEPGPDTQRKILALAAVAEAGTGLALMIDPAIVARLLLGAELAVVGTVLGRCFGIALLALGLACWPSRQRGDGGSPTVRGMSTYNALIALYLAWLGIVGHRGGPLLWPAVALHAVVALLLVWTGRREKSAA
jgi:Ca2+/Na+ antiporter